MAKAMVILDNGDIRDLVNGKIVKKYVNGVKITVIWDTYFDELIGKVVDGIKTNISATECDVSQIVPEEIAITGIDISNGPDMTGGI